MEGSIVDALLHGVAVTSYAPVLFFTALYFRRGLRKLAGSPERAAYLFGFTQVLMTIARTQGSHELCQSTVLGGFSPLQLPGAALMAIGQLLNVAVYYRIGILGVYYGAAFGCKLQWVRGFPFVVPHPQYTGATLTVLGSALYYGSYFGLVFTLLTVLGYVVIINIERHFFGEIDRQRAGKGGKARK